MKRKPFTLEEWLKDTSQPVYTRDGRNLKELKKFDSKGSFGHSLVGIMEGDNQDFLCWYDDGSYYHGSIDNKDLMLVDKDPLDEVEEFVKKIKANWVVHDEELDTITFANKVLEFIKKLKGKENEQL